MSYELAHRRLRNHANLVADETDVDGFIAQLSLADRSGELPDIDPIVADILSCLAIANSELNGPRPSATTAGQQRPEVLAELASPMAGLLAEGLKYHTRWSERGWLSERERDSVIKAVYRIAVAWDLVLAGDIDDIVAEVQLQLDASI